MEIRKSNLCADNFVQSSIKNEMKGCWWAKSHNFVIYNGVLNQQDANFKKFKLSYYNHVNNSKDAIHINTVLNNLQSILKSYEIEVAVVNGDALHQLSLKNSNPSSDELFECLANKLELKLHVLFASGKLFQLYTKCAHKIQSMVRSYLYLKRLRKKRNIKLKTIKIQSFIRKYLCNKRMRVFFENESNIPKYFSDKWNKNRQKLYSWFEQVALSQHFNNNEKKSLTGESIDSLSVSLNPETICDNNSILHFALPPPTSASAKSRLLIYFPSAYFGEQPSLTPLNLLKDKNVNMVYIWPAQFTEFLQENIEQSLKVLGIEENFKTNGNIMFNSRLILIIQEAIDWLPSMLLSFSQKSKNIHSQKDEENQTSKDKHFKLKDVVKNKVFNHIQKQNISANGFIPCASDFLTWCSRFALINLRKIVSQSIVDGYFPLLLPSSDCTERNYVKRIADYLDIPLLCGNPDICKQFSDVVYSRNFFEGIKCKTPPSVNSKIKSIDSLYLSFAKCIACHLEINQWVISFNINKVSRNVSFLSPQSTNVNHLQQNSNNFSMHDLHHCRPIENFNETTIPYCVIETSSLSVILQIRKEKNSCDEINWMKKEAQLAIRKRIMMCLKNELHSIIAHSTTRLENIKQNSCFANSWSHFTYLIETCGCFIEAVEDSSHTNINKDNNTNNLFGNNNEIDLCLGIVDAVSFISSLGISDDTFIAGFNVMNSEKSNWFEQPSGYHFPQSRTPTKALEKAMKEISFHLHRTHQIVGYVTVRFICYLNLNNHMPHISAVRISFGLSEVISAFELVKFSYLKYFEKMGDKKNSLKFHRNLNSSTYKQYIRHLKNISQNNSSVNGSNNKNNNPLSSNDINNYKALLDRNKFDSLSIFGTEYIEIDESFNPFSSIPANSLSNSSANSRGKANKSGPNMLYIPVIYETSLLSIRKESFLRLCRDRGVKFDNEEITGSLLFSPHSPISEYISCLCISHGQRLTNNIALAALSVISKISSDKTNSNSSNSNTSSNSNQFKKQKEIPSCFDPVTMYVAFKRLQAKEEEIELSANLNCNVWFE